MSLKTILNKQTDFTGEFEPTDKTGGLWRMNESDSDVDDNDCYIADSSGCGRNAEIVN